MLVHYRYSFQVSCFPLDAVTSILSSSYSRKLPWRPIRIEANSWKLCFQVPLGPYHCREYYNNEDVKHFVYSTMLNMDLRLLLSQFTAQVTISQINQ